MTVARVSVRFSKSLARRRFRPSQEKVHSTTPAARQDDEAVHGVAPPNDLHAQRRYFCHRSFNLPRVATAIGPDRFEPRETPPATRSRVMGDRDHVDRYRAGRCDGHRHPVGTSRLPVAVLIMAGLGRCGLSLDWGKPIKADHGND